MPKNNKHWSNEDTAFLRENYGILPIDELANRLARSEEAVRWRASDLGLTKKKLNWSKDELILLAENLSSHTYEELAAKLGRTVRSVAHKVSELKIARNFKAPKLEALESDITYYKGKAGEYKALLSAMEVGQSFAYPTDEKQTIRNQILYFPDRVYRTRQIDATTRRVWRLL